MRFSIVAMAPNPWRGQWVNRQYLLTRLGSRHEVAYSTGAWYSWDRVSPAWQAAPLLGSSERLDGVTVDIAPKALLRSPRVPVWDSFVLSKHATRLTRHVCTAGARLDIALLFHPSFYPYLRHLRPRLIAYHAYDLFEGTHGWTAEDERMERLLVNQADVVTTVSEAIAVRLKAKGARKVSIIPNGVDLDLFDAADKSKYDPPDLADIPAPRLGYIGSLHPQVDFELIAQLACHHPSWQFVLVGGSPNVVDARFEAAISDCRSLKNIHFLGEKSRFEVPQYMLNMDVNIMPYKISADTWIKAGHPLKLYEYLACKKPVVSADLPAVRALSNRVIKIATGFDEWRVAISEAISGQTCGNPAVRYATARENGWDERSSLLEALLTDAFSNQFVFHKVV